MFELPEIATLAKQIAETLAGKTIKEGCLGNAPHKFVWYNRTPSEFRTLTRGKVIGEARAKGKWLLVALEPGYVLLLGECGGRVLFHPSGSLAPKKYHLLFTFEDGSALSVTTQMWGALELYERGQEANRQYLRDMRPTPVEPTFTFEYFSALIDELAQGEKRSAKGLLTQEQLIPGLGNALAQDILFRAKLHPKHPLAELDKAGRRRLYRAIQGTVTEAIKKGGRNDEYDLHNRPGSYRRVMDRAAAGHPCPVCGTQIEKMPYLGGACYFCPRCQQ